MYVFGALSDECRVKPDGTYYEIGVGTYPGNPEGTAVKLPPLVTMPDTESTTVGGAADGDNSGTATQ
jgi:hypothetical protein